MSNTKKKILILYYYWSPLPMRQNTLDNLQALKEYSDHNCYYCNVCYGIPFFLSRQSWDLIVFHITFTCGILWTGAPYEKYIACVEPLRNHPSRKIMLVQDEFYRTERLCKFINSFNIWGIFSVAEKTEWPKIYRNIDFTKVKFYTVLTGYFTDNITDIITSLSKENLPRTIDIGYRAWQAEYWVGRHGVLKAKIAEKFKENARGLNIDVSTDPRDTFYGLDWYRFQLRCKYTIGVEGGSSLLDYDGTLQSKVNEFLKANPHAHFDECEAACFPGLDGNLDLYAISPRHLEACATKTCQILIEGHYNGILHPWKHYIPLKKDFSNIEEVLQLVKEDSLRADIVERAFDDIVKSNQYTYRKFVGNLFDISLEGVSTSSPSSKFARTIHNLLEHWKGKLITCDAKSRHYLKIHLPPKVINALKKIKLN